ncbi:amidase [Pseudoclavibacter sp. 13-3]|uniref:amidase n=1 Tax=Pseudoclavibacter sp. 13-3 TaxID=2901228 RepID=UPI001E3D1755|nr:amidase [Pseudoclavibacter sp. 13-3]MCD7101323.1 amidase [Pseudoclavibacter sp. 13-3]
MADTTQLDGSADPNDLAWAGAGELVQAYSARRLRPSTVVEALLSRIDRLEPRLNAVTETLADSARARAAEADLQYAQAVDAGVAPAELLAERPLLGVPVVLKEKHDLSGHTVTQGVVELAEESTANHPIVERLLAAGAVPIVRSTVPEFCAATVTESLQWGVTCNPWNTECSPGGSSGGSGAALAAGYAPLATGSDIGGSTRIPACYCGVVGYKAPYAVVPGQLPSSMDWYRGDSAMGRTVDDVRVMHNVIAGQHVDDQLSIPSAPINAQPRSLDLLRERLAGSRVVLSTALGDYPVEPDTVRALQASAQALTELGVEIVEREPDWHADELMQTAFAHYGHILAPSMADAIERAQAAVSPYITQFVEHALATASRIPLHETFRRETIIRDQLSTVMHGAIALLAPVTARTALPARAPALSIDGHGRHYWQQQMAVPFNINNRCPVLAVPSGIGGEGVPTGLQIVGRPYAQDDVFLVGSALEALRPWHERHPSL